MLNLYELFEKNGIVHHIPWEAYRLDNGLVVKIDVSSDPRYPFKVGEKFEFISHRIYGNGGALYILHLTPDNAEKFPERITGIENGQPVYEKYQAHIIEKIDLYKVIDLNQEKIDFELLNFTLNGMPLYSEVLVYMMQEIHKLNRRTKDGI